MFVMIQILDDTIMYHETGVNHRPKSFGGQNPESRDQSSRGNNNGGGKMHFSTDMIPSKQDHPQKGGL
jgi:hypothetical protein